MDLYYGGTTYENSQGLGFQLTPAAQRGESVSLGWVKPPEARTPEDGLLAVPVTRLYDRAQTSLPSLILHARIPEAYVVLNPADATRAGIAGGERVVLMPGGEHSRPSSNIPEAVARLSEDVPVGIVLVPRSIGLPVREPQTVVVRLAERATA
jgi:NADH-quinone oxidoreductase subunit G